MANGNNIALVGNITRDPELRFTPTGQATATFGLAVNRRWQNRQTQEWEEATSFFDVVCWREMAENASESLARGSRVIVTGRLEQRSWETQDGDKRSKVEIVADEIGPSLRWATAQVTKNERRGPGEGAPPRVAAAARPGSLPPSRRATAAPATASTRNRSEPWRSSTERSTRRRATSPARRLDPDDVRAVSGQGGVGRLQERHPAAPLHERPGQDPRPGGHRELRPAPG